MDSIRIKRGPKALLPSDLPLGELAFCTDTRELYVGMGEGIKPRPVTNTEITEHLAEWKEKYQDVSDQFQAKYNGLEQEYATRLTEVKEQLEQIKTNTGISVNTKNEILKEKKENILREKLGILSQVEIMKQSELLTNTTELTNLRQSESDYINSINNLIGIIDKLLEGGENNG